MDDADAALPRTTVLKLAREALPADVRISVETQDVLLECSSEFVKLLATQANEVSCRLQKKTVQPEHVVAALEELGFSDMVEDIREHLVEWETVEREKPKMTKKTKAQASGLTEAEQIEMQGRLFAEAAARAAG